MPDPGAITTARTGRHGGLALPSPLAGRRGDPELCWGWGGICMPLPALANSGWAQGTCTAGPRELLLQPKTVQ